MEWIPGSRLSSNVQREALSIFVHRFTGDHRPEWASEEWKEGKSYPLQFKDDRDWLKNTLFAVTERDNLDKRVDHCYSSPTWPDNPELRRAAEARSL